MRKNFVNLRRKRLLKKNAKNWIKDRKNCVLGLVHRVIKKKARRKRKRRNQLRRRQRTRRSTFPTRNTTARLTISNRRSALMALL